jgi:hypothetical protein
MNSPALAILFVLLCAAFVGGMGYFWYRRNYRPGKEAASALDSLSSALARRTSDWHPAGRVDLRVPLSQDVRIVARGQWRGRPGSMQLHLAVGVPPGSFWDDGETGVAATELRLTVKTAVPGGLAGLERYDDATVAVNHVFAFLGATPKLKPLPDDFYVYGDDETITRLFPSAVRECAGAFPRKIFGLGYGGIVVQGSEVRLRWEGHESDPAVVAAGFALLDSVVNGSD